MTQIKPERENNSLVSFYVIWKERSSDGIKHKRVACFDEKDANNKVKKLEDLRYVFDIEKRRSDSA
ncbi:hypothetical protein DSAG12_04355 [Promethearchaeum syntrophicum]|uniref:Uncharacterized protein n=1 Tax=Promethearchaeum syntrophicum TaxID=2594042 RepID=A0AC61ZU18_9ARCH